MRGPLCRPASRAGEASLTPGNTVGVDERGDGGLSVALSAPLVRPWQVDWQGLHPEVGGLGAKHRVRLGVCLRACTSARASKHMLVCVSAVPLAI